MEMHSQQKIKMLENKLKQLEKQIAERVRSFLLHSNQKRVIPMQHFSRLIQTENIQWKQTNTIQNSTQTQKIEEALSNSYNLLQESGVSVFQLNSENPNNQTFGEDSSPFKTNQISSFSIENYEQSLLANKRQAGLILLKLIESQEKGENSEVLTLEESITSNKDQLTDQFYKRERRKMRKQIKKLKDKLEFQSTVITQAKQGLLQSQQENYSFRLKISDLAKRLQQQQKQRHQFQLKIEFLQRENQSTNNRLKEATKTLRKQESKSSQKSNSINQNNNTIQKNQENIIEQREPQNQEECFDREGSQHKVPSFQEILKDKLHIIASLLPAKIQSHQVTMFKPQNQQQILQILLQIEAYFVQAEKTLENVIQQANHSKNTFLAAIQCINSVLSHQTRLLILQKLTFLPALKPYLSILSKSQTFEDSSK